MRAASRIPIFTHDIHLSRSDAPQVLQGMLHTICFVRMLGLLQPDTQIIKNVSMPYVNDVATQARIARAACDMFDALDQKMSKQRSIVCVDVVVGWHRLLAPPNDTDTQPTRTASPEPGSMHYAVFESPYSWLASALAGGRTTTHLETRDERSTQRLLPRDASLDSRASDVFEQWVLSLHIHYDQEDTKLSEALTDYVMAAVSFANEHQDKLPAVTDTAVCPFPFTMNSTVRER